MEFYISTNIRFLRKTVGMTQYHLADILGVKRNTISNYETEISRPEYGYLLTIARVFNVSVEDLLITDLSKSTKANKILSTVNDPIAPYKKIGGTVKYDSIPLIEEKNRRFYLDSKNKNAYVRKLPYLTLPYYKGKKVRAFELADTSFSPAMAEQDVVVGILDENGIDNLLQGGFYVLVTKDNIYIKRVFFGLQKDKLELKSDNAEFHPVFIETSNVEEIWKITHTIRINRDVIPTKENGNKNTLK